MELRIPYNEIRDSQQITQVIKTKLAHKFGDANALHRWEVTKLEDDDSKRIRVITLRPKTYFVMG